MEVAHQYEVAATHRQCADGASPRLVAHHTQGHRGHSCWGTVHLPCHPCSKKPSPPLTIALPLLSPQYAGGAAHAKNDLFRVVLGAHLRVIGGYGMGF